MYAFDAVYVLFGFLAGVYLMVSAMDTPDG